ncbi:MAG: hypothetical protein M3132_06125 [Actinomycetia bacterium]|nr:hypothetical protein [Actinomycetes bacterium]
MVAVMGVSLILLMGVAAVGSGIAAYAKAAVAADAAALAAAPVTFRPFGAIGTPEQEAARFAAANGSLLTDCRCPVDRSWSRRTVEVRVIRTVSVPGIGAIAVSASSRATFDPSKLLEP